MLWKQTTLLPTYNQEKFEIALSVFSGYLLLYLNLLIVSSQKYFHLPYTSGLCNVDLTEKSQYSENWMSDSPLLVCSLCSKASKSNSFSKWTLFVCKEERNLYIWDISTPQIYYLFSYTIMTCIQCIYIYANNKNTVNVVDSLKWACMWLCIHWIYSGQNIARKRTKNKVYFFWYAITHLYSLLANKLYFSV